MNQARRTLSTSHRAKRRVSLDSQLAILDQASANEFFFPGLQAFDRLLYASGGARVDGQLLVTRLLEVVRSNWSKKSNSDTFSIRLPD